MAVTRRDIKDIKSLLTNKGRRLLDQFSAEGVRLLEDALKHQFLPEKVFYAESLISDRGINLLRDLQKHEIALEKISTRQLEQMADTRSPQGFLAVFKLPHRNLAKLYRYGPRRILLCDGISDPGNLGTLARSALAFGFGAMILTGECAEPYSPKVVRSSMGALFAMKVVACSTSDFIRQFHGDKFRMIAADLTGHDIRPTTFGKLKEKNIVLALGSEAHGLSQGIVNAADMRVRLVHAVRVESLNVAVAGSILMQHIYSVG